MVFFNVVVGVVVLVVAGVILVVAVVDIFLINSFFRSFCLKIVGPIQYICRLFQIHFSAKVNCNLLKTVSKY